MRSSQLRAFTLIELLMVMVILTLVVAIVAPSLRGFAIGRRNKDAATMVVALARYARAQAVNEGRTYRLNFEPSAGALWLTADQVGAFVEPTNEFGKRFEIPRGVVMEVDAPQRTDGQYVEFMSSGRGESTQIRLTNNDGELIHVGCLSATENYRVLRPEEVQP